MHSAALARGAAANQVSPAFASNGAKTGANGIALGLATGRCNLACSIETLGILYGSTKSAHTSDLSDGSGDGGSQNATKRVQMIPWLPILGIFLSLAITAFNITVVFFTIEINRSDKFSGNLRTLYNTGITLLATVFSYFITTQIRSHSLRSIGYRLSSASDNDALEKLEMAWRANLGLFDLKEGIFNLSSWPIQLLYLSTALLTTAMVAATTPTLSIKSLPYSPRIPSGISTPCAGPWPWRTYELPGYHPGNYIWRPADRPAYHANLFPNDICPDRTIPGALGSVNILTPHAFAYSSDSVAIHTSAIGTPESLFSVSSGSGGGLEDAMSMYDSSLLSTEQCAPVMLSNPVSCRPEGETTVNNHKYTPYLSVSSGNCTHTSTENSFFVSNICMTEANEIGSGTIVIGAYWSGARKLARWTGNLTLADDPDKTFGRSATYAITCDFDANAVVGWRHVRLYTQHSATRGNPYRQWLVGGSSCTPQADVNRAYYTALAASGLAVPLELSRHDKSDSFESLASLLQNSFTDMKQNSSESGLIWARTSFAFNDSTNALEDVLGVIMGISMSKAPARSFRRASSGFQDGAGHHTDSDKWFIKLTGTQTLSIVRVGPGKTFGLVYAIPPLITFLYGLWLLLWHPWQPTRYKASRMQDLISYGRQLGKAER